MAMTVIECPCGCRERFEPGAKGRRYATAACRQRAYKRRRDNNAVTSPKANPITKGTECTQTTSGTTYLHLAVSGGPSPITPSSSSASTLRQRRRGGRVVARCPSCKQFVRNPAARCQCGYDRAMGWAA